MAVTRVYNQVFQDSPTNNIVLPGVANRKMIVRTTAENASNGFNITEFTLNGIACAQVTDGITLAHGKADGGGRTNEEIQYFLDIPDAMSGTVPLVITYDVGFAGRIDSVLIYTGLKPGNCDYSDGFQSTTVITNTINANPVESDGVIVQFASCGDQGSWTAGGGETLIEQGNATSMSGMTSEKIYNTNAANSMTSNGPIIRRYVQTLSVWGEPGGAPPSGRIMGSLAGKGGLAGPGGLAG